MRQLGNFRKSLAGVEPARNQMSSAQVLVVDDDAGHAASVRELLSAHGYSVDFELEGAQGLRRIKADGVDVLILDLDMPNMSGIDMLQALGPDTDGLKTIVVSGESHVEKITPILRLGAYDYLPSRTNPSSCWRAFATRSHERGSNARIARCWTRRKRRIGATRSSSMHRRI